MASGHDSYHATALPASQEDGAAHERIGEFDAFFREQYEALLHFVRRRSRTHEDAEDVAQESLARFIRYTGTQPPEAWKPTLYRIAINVVNDRQRKERTHSASRHVPLEELEAESGPDRVQADQRSVEEEAVLAQQRVQLRRAILALPPKCRQVYLLKYVRGMTGSEVARHCGISVSMVEKHLANALAQIARRLGNPASGTY